VKMSRVSTNTHIETSLELDSHADTTVLRADALIPKLQPISGSCWV
jgi:hypothetical protein